MLSNPNYSISGNTEATGRGILHQNPGPLLLRLVSPPPNHLPRLPTAPSASFPVQCLPVTLHSRGHRRRLEHSEKQPTQAGRATIRTEPGRRRGMTTLACHSAAAIGVPLRAESWPSPQGLAHYRWTPSAGGKKDWRHSEVSISNGAAGVSPGARLSCLLRTSGSLPGTAAKLDVCASENTHRPSGDHGQLSH